MPQDLDLLTLKEAARLTARSESSIRDWVRAGHLEKHPPKEGDRYKRVRVARAAVLARAEKLDADRLPSPSIDKPEEVEEEPTEKPNPGDVGALESELVVFRARLESQLEVGALLRAAKEALDLERKRFAETIERERAIFAEVEKAHETKASGLEQAIQAHMGATEAERRRADEAVARAADLSDKLEATRAELEAVRLASGRSWWQKLLPG
jgi:hypothetical protein